MKIKAVHLLAESLPGVSTRCFTSDKGDEFVSTAAGVFVTTGASAARRYFFLPMSGVRLELHALPDIGEAKAAKK